jgi:hypothetical protein
MPASAMLPDQIVRKLEDAIDRLNTDFEKVEFWAAALNAFLQPVPGYEAPGNEHLLRPQQECNDHAKGSLERSSGGP